MSVPIEDYALLSNCRTAALVSAEGSIDWLCLPRFDAPSVFAALLGDESHGCWTLHPTDASTIASRHYLPDTFILVTRWQTSSGIAEVHDFLAMHAQRADLVRRIVGISGTVEFSTELRLRFDYARSLPWVRQIGSARAPALWATAGPDSVVVRGAKLVAQDLSHGAVFTIVEDETRDLTMTWSPSYDPSPSPPDVDAAVINTREWWQGWASTIECDGPHRERVIRSLLVLRALTHRDTGGIVAAPTTSLPEDFGGERNWDYRFVWLRDAALTLQALIEHGFLEEVHHWRNWLLRAVAGDTADVQIMYGVAGERDLAERIMPSLPGYDGAAPVRVGNAAVGQYQGDVIGEVLVALEAARVAGLEESPYSWSLQRALLDQVVADHDKLDHGIWEIRGDPQWFVHSKAMMWAALDRGVRGVREQGMTGDAAVWERVRDDLRHQIDARGVHPAGGYFVQHEGSEEVDAALLVLAQVGFCQADDPRMLRTVAQMEASLFEDGLLLRYRTQTGVDGLAGDENPFLACSFWLVEQYARSGRRADAEALMARLVGFANDVGLLAEEYDVRHARHAGNTPQALSHLSLVRAAAALAALGPAAGEAPKQA